MGGKYVSSRKRIAAIVAVILVPMLLFFICYTFLSLLFLFENNANASLSVLDVYKTELESSLRFIDNELSQRISNDEYFQYLSKKQNELDAFLYAEELQKKNADLMNISGVIGFMSIYSSANDLYRPYNYGGSYEYNKKEAIIETARMLSENGEKYADSLWLPTKVIDGNFLFRVIGRHSGDNKTYFVCMVDLDKWTASINGAKPNLGGNILVCHSLEHGILTNKGHLESINASLSENSGSYYFTGKPSQIAVGRLSDYAGIHLSRLSEYKTLSGANFGESMMILFALLLLLTVPLAYWLLNKSFVRPLEEITNTMLDISQGNTNKKMRDDFSVKELRTLSTTFNDMVTQINSLKIEHYEKLIQARELQLQYLQIQINPHFFLNCLKSLYGLSQENNREGMQNIIISFSEYVRHMLRADMKNISVEKELSSIEKYIELQQLTASQPISCKIDVSRELYSMEIPPLSLLTFVENSLKHGMRPGQAIVLQLSGRLLNSEDGSFAHFTINDNGGGFSEDMLKKLNQPAFLDEPTGELHVGIENVKKRMKLFYGDSASISFYNLPRGASVEIYIARKPDKITDEEGERD